MFVKSRYATASSSGLLERCMQASNGHSGAVVVAKSELQICVDSLRLRRFGQAVGDDASDHPFDSIKKRDRAEIVHGVWALGRVLD